MANPSADPGRPEREVQVRRIISSAAEGKSVEAVFEAGRRASDLTRVTLKGQKEAVLNLPIKLLDGLPQEDIELIESSGDRRRYSLTFVVTERLEDQESSAPERRAKLQHFLNREAF